MNEKDTDSNNTSNSAPEMPADLTREEYVEKLKQWVQEARLWHGFCAGFSTYYYASVQPGAQNLTTNNVQPPQFNVNSVIHGHAPQEYLIPPMWKRFAAEVIDFFILFLMKMLFTFLILENFDILEFGNYGMDSLQKSFRNPKVAMQWSVEMITLEVIHRIVVCCYETYCINSSACATPGKKCMGLMVVYVSSIELVPGRVQETVRAHPCTVLGFQRAVLRALLKNIFVGLLLPVCFALMFFKYNRTGYDLLVNSLVVESNNNEQIRAV